MTNAEVLQPETPLSYSIPAYISRPANRFEVAENIANFLAANGMSVYASAKIKSMKAKDQRAVFGCFLGKGTILVDGRNDEVTHFVTVCFGMDRERSAWISCGDNVVGSNTYGPCGPVGPHLEDARAMGFQG